MDAQLLEFTRSALQSGSGRAEIAGALRRAGWAEADIATALGAFAEVEFPVPVPRPTPYLSAREVFVYLTLFAALYASAYNLAALAFQFINRAFPDPLETSYAVIDREAIRWSVSALIVAFPLFLFTFRAVSPAIERDPTKRGSRPRKWLTYLTLFIAGVSLAGDLMALVYNALGGELTIRFGLKVATVAVIAGGTFTFFLTDMRKEEKP